MRFLNDKKFYRLGSTLERETDARIISATNKNLQQLIKERKFGEDLYFRLAKFEFKLPPLRERGEDIILITEKFLKKHSEEQGLHLKRFSEEAKECLLKYHYPGNARDVDRFTLQAMCRADGNMIEVKDLSKELQEGSGRGPVADDRKSNFISEKASKNDNTNSPLPHGKFHDQIFINVKNALDSPLKVASEKTKDAFERNFIIAKLIVTNGNVKKAARIVKIDQSSFINKMKKFELKREWYVQ